MQYSLVKICYRHIIDINCSSSFEQAVFNDSYQEFLLQVQRYNKGNKLRSFKEVVALDPKANSLHYKVGFAVGLYVQELQGFMPGIVDSLGQTGIPFSRHELTIIDSDILDQRNHVVALTYTSCDLAFLGNAGDHMILSLDNIDQKQASEWVSTFLLKVEPGLSVQSMLFSPSLQPVL